MADVVVQPQTINVVVQPNVPAVVTAAVTADTITLSNQNQSLVVPTLSPINVTPIALLDQIITLSGSQGPPGPPGSGGGSGSRFVYPFTQANVSSGGVVPVFHNGNSFASGVSVFDGDSHEIDPDELFGFTLSAFAVRLVSFLPLQGNWQILFSL